jgi:hypothetical protein
LHIFTQKTTQPEIEPGERQAILNMFDFARQQGWMTGPGTTTTAPK